MGAAGTFIFLLVAMAAPAVAQDTFDGLPGIKPALQRQFDETGVDSRYWRVGRFRAEVAARLLDVGRLDEAKALYEELVANAWRNPLDVALGRAGLGRVAAFEGRHEVAVELFAGARMALQDGGFAEERRGVGLSWLAWVVIDEAAALHRLGRDTEALPLIDAALAREGPFDFSGQTAPLVDARATALEGLGRLVDAEGARARSLDALRGRSEARPIDIAAAEARLAENLIRQGKSAQAEALLAHALSVYAVTLPAGHPAAIEAGGTAARLRLTALGKPAVALADLRRLAAAILGRADRSRPDLRADSRLKRHRDLFGDRVAAAWAVFAGTVARPAAAVAASAPARIAGHGAEIESLAFSPDGRLLASGDGEGTLILWNVAQGTAVAEFTGAGRRGHLYRLGFLDGGGTVYGAYSDDRLLTWPVAGGAAQVAAEFAQAHAGALAAISDDGKMLAIADPRRELAIVERASGRRVVVPLTWARIADIAFAPDGRTVALAEWHSDAPNDPGYGQLCLYRTADARRIACRRTNMIESIHFAAAGRSLLVNPVAGSLLRLDAANLEGGPLLPEVAGSDRFAMSPDGTRLATISGDGAIQLRDAATGLVVTRLDGHVGDIGAIAFSPDGTMLATGATDKSVRLWRVTDGASIHVLGERVGFARHGGDIRSVAFSPDGTRIISGALDNSRLWDATTGIQLQTWPGWWASYAPDGKRLLTGGIVRDAASGDEVMRIAVAGDAQYFLPWGGIATILGDQPDDRHVQLSDAGGKPIARIPMAFGDQLVTAPRGPLLAIRSISGGFRIWNGQTGQPVSPAYANPGAALIGFTPSGNDVLVVIGNVVAIVDRGLAAPKRLFVLPGWFTAISDVALSPDGTDVVASNSATAYRATSVPVPRPGDPPPPEPPAARPLAMRGPVRHALRSGDGATMMFGRADGVLLFVDCATGAERAQVKPHGGEIDRLLLSPDGRRVLSVGKDRTMSLWDIASASLVTRLGD